jgi:hypothetical protein
LALEVGGDGALVPPRQGFRGSVRSHTSQHAADALKWRFSRWSQYFGRHGCDGRRLWPAR